MNSTTPILIHTQSEGEWHFRCGTRVVTLPKAEVTAAVSPLHSVYEHRYASADAPIFEGFAQWLVLLHWMQKDQMDACVYVSRELYHALPEFDWTTFTEDTSETWVLNNKNAVHASHSGALSYWKRQELERWCRFILDQFTDADANVPWRALWEITLLSKTYSGVSYEVFLEKFVASQSLYSRPIALNLPALPSATSFLVERALREWNTHTHAPSILSLAKGRFKKLVKNVLAPKTVDAPFGWKGNYATWTEAAAECSGYDATGILQTVAHSVEQVWQGKAAYERDSVTFDEVQLNFDLLHTLWEKSKSGRLEVVDFGGSLGSSYLQHRMFFRHLPSFRWTVVEQSHFVELGKAQFTREHLHFALDVEEALQAQKPQVLLVSSVLQYFDEPYVWMEKLISFGFETILIDRTAFIEGNTERITKQIVPSFIYEASYPAWFFNEEKFIRAFESAYTLEASWYSPFDPREALEDGTVSYRKGFYFKRR